MTRPMMQTCFTCDMGNRFFIISKDKKIIIKCCHCGDERPLDDVKMDLS